MDSAIPRPFEQFSPVPLLRCGFSGAASGRWLEKEDDSSHLWTLVKYFLKMLKTRLSVLSLTISIWSLFQESSVCLEPGIFRQQLRVLVWLDAVSMVSETLPESYGLHAGRKKPKLQIPS
jgi:hypothetical protein